MDVLAQIKFIIKSPMFLWTFGVPIIFFVLVDVVVLIVTQETYQIVVYLAWAVLMLVIFLAVFVSAAPHFVTAREVDYLEAHKAVIYPGLEIHFDEQDIFSPYLTRVMMSVDGHRKKARPSYMMSLAPRSA